MKVLYPSIDGTGVEWSIKDGRPRADACATPVRKQH